ncbi:hypothetical protein PV325_011595 [Microctonus aethiopoides]|nr:hypothetical protein PV325_011595 [Microctonus aethiopoides]
MLGGESGVSEIYSIHMNEVATRPWSPDQGKTREMTKLCNHKRKLLLPVAAASPVASCTPVVSSSTLSAPGAPVIHANADSPTSTDKLKKDTPKVELSMVEKRMSCGGKK